MIRSSNNKCVQFLATDRVNLYTCRNYVVFKVSFRCLLVGKKRGVCLCGESVLFIVVMYKGVVCLCLLLVAWSLGGGTTTGCRSRVDGNSSACHGLMVQG